MRKEMGRWCCSKWAGGAAHAFEKALGGKARATWWQRAALSHFDQRFFMPQ